MKRKSKGIYYKEPPQLPCEVYKASSSRVQIPLIFAALMVITAMYVFVFNNDKGLGIMLLLFAPSIALTSQAKGYNTKNVFLTSKTISADMGDEKIREENLDKYALLLTRQLKDRGNYRYQVYIRREDMNSRDILLVENVTCPINLSEWIKSLQNQLDAALPIKFSGEQMERDYKTGVYKSKRNVRFDVSIYKQQTERIIVKCFYNSEATLGGHFE